MNLIEVSVLRAHPKRIPGVVVHRRTGIGESDVRRRHGIRVTDPICTLIDIAARLTRDEWEAAVNDADRLDLVDPEGLRRVLDETPLRRGVSLLRETDRRTFTFTRSALERRFLEIAGAAGLSRPQTCAWVNGFEVDFYFADIDLVVETDGLRYHRTPAQQARDRLRDQAHTAAGLTQLRFTHAQIRYRPDYVRRILRQTAARAASATR